jgi:hypothetical protein
MNFLHEASHFGLILRKPIADNITLAFQTQL